MKAWRSSARILPHALAAGLVWTALAGCARKGPRPPAPPPAALPARIGEAGGDHGPTLPLATADGAGSDMALADFMYFVPLISPAPVAVAASPGNTQRARLLKTSRRFLAESFTATVDFEILGQGFLQNSFDPTNQIRRHAQRLHQGGVLERQLGGILIAGSGRGRIEVTGTISNQLPVVTEVRLRFNAEGTSPVSICLHDLRYADGAYCRENEMVARVNTLTFRRAPGRPKMEATLGTVRPKGAGDGLWQRFVGGVTATAANLLLKPITVDRAGHEAMLEFGLALATGQPTFTFPRAKNLKASSTASRPDLLQP